MGESRVTSAGRRGVGRPRGAHQGEQRDQAQDPADAPAGRLVAVFDAVAAGARDRSAQDVVDALDVGGLPSIFAFQPGYQLSPRTTTPRPGEPVASMVTRSGS